MTEFQIHLTDDRAAFDIPIEANSAGSAILKAHKAVSFIKQKYADDPACKKIHLGILVEVIRHDADFIEHHPIYIDCMGFVDHPKEHRA